MDFYKNKKIFITGNTGFKGSWLTLALKNFGADVTGYSDKLPLKKSLINESWINSNIRQYIKDVENYDDLFKAIKKNKPDIIFHLAAQPLVLESYKKPYKTFITNVMGTINILEAIKNIDPSIPTIIVTTDKVYSNKKNKKYKEDDILDGIDPYSTSKVCAENIAKSYSKLGLKVITARAGNIIGGGDWSKNRIIPDIIRAIKNNKTLNIRNPLHTRPWLYILDVIEGYMLLGKELYYNENKNFFESYNLAPVYKNPYTVSDLAKALLQQFNKEKYFHNTKEKIQENKLLAICPNKIGKKLNWIAKTSFNEAISNTAKWYKISNQSKCIKFSINHINQYFNTIHSHNSEKKIRVRSYA